MKADFDQLKTLNEEGRVRAHNNGPPPELVIQLFDTRQAIWHAELCEFEIEGVTHYSIPTIIALEKDGEYILPQDIKTVVKYLGEFFYSCGAFKMQGGAEFGGRFKNIPPLIFVWWD